MPHAIQIRQTGGPEVLNWTPIEVGELFRGAAHRGRSTGAIARCDLLRSSSRERREELEASTNELFNVVASGKVRINVNRRFALKDAADAHKALEARASTVLIIEPTVHRSFP